MIKYILLSISLTVLNLLVWTLATGTYELWDFAGTESKNMFVVWMAICLIAPIVIGFIIEYGEA